MKTFLFILPVLIIGAVLAGCGGGGGQSTPPVDPNAHPYAGTWKMVDGNAKLTVASDGKATLRTTDGDGVWVTFSGSISESGAMQVKGPSVST